MGTHERREREKQKRREDILSAAQRLFWKHGYTHSTMPQIAKAAELAPGTLYLYFPSKSALYAELLIRGYDELIPRLESSVATEAAPEKQAEALVDAFFAFACDCPEVFNIIFFLLQQEGRGPRQEALEGDVLERLQARENACKAVAGRVLQQLGGDARAPQARIDALWSMLAGVVFFFRGNGPEALGGVAVEARTVLLAALFGRR